MLMDNIIYLLIVYYIGNTSLRHKYTIYSYQFIDDTHCMRIEGRCGCIQRVKWVISAHAGKLNFVGLLTFPPEVAILFRLVRQSIVSNETAATTYLHNS